MTYILQKHIREQVETGCKKQERMDCDTSIRFYRGIRPVLPVLTNCFSGQSLQIVSQFSIWLVNWIRSMYSY